MVALDSREWEIGRMAMAIDTDGHIGIGNYQGSGGHSIYMGFTNTNVKLIEWIVNNFSGKMPKREERDNIKWKDRYDWKIHGYKAYKILKSIRPYLIAKQEQADCAIELYEKVTKWHYGATNPIPDYKRELAESLYQRCRQLNEKGKPAEQVGSEPKLKSRKTIETLEEYV